MRKTQVIVLSQNDDLARLQIVIGRDNKNAPLLDEICHYRFRFSNFFSRGHCKFLSGIVGPIPLKSFGFFQCSIN